VRDAVSLAARNNPALAANVVNVKIADANVVAASGVDDFVWDASAAWSRSRSQYTPGTLSQETKGDDGIFSTSLTRSLPTGGSMGLRFSADVGTSTSVTDLGSGPQEATSTLHSPAVQLFVTQSLLRGAGVAVARADRRRAAVARDVAGLERDAAAASVIRDVVQAYWSTVLAVEEVEILRALTESARQQLASVQAAISVEKLPASASAEVKVAAALREDAEISAEQDLLGQQAELGRLMGVTTPPSASPWSLTERPDVVPISMSFDAALAAAIEENPQLAAVRARGRLATIDVDVTENGLLPQLDLGFSGEMGNTSNPAATFGQLGSFRTYDFLVSLTFRQPIGQHAERGALSAAHARLHKAKLAEVDIAGQIRSAVVRQVGMIDAARRRIAALGEVIETATLDLAAERARFEVGRATNFDVLRRQEELAQARLHALRARIDYLNATAALEVLTGDILQKYGVVVR
jgi:outer membrane protein TolC